MTRQRPKSGCAPWLMVAIVLFALLSAAYMGTYYAMLESKAFFGTFSSDVSYPIYRSDEAWVRSALAPAHQIDCAIRPDYWSNPSPY